MNVPPHPIPAGPLAVRWLSYELPEPRAGTTRAARVRLENAGTAAWPSGGVSPVLLSYHWLDPLGNALVLDGIRTPLAGDVRPGESIDVDLTVAFPLPPGPRRIELDLLIEGRTWFAELGNTPLAFQVDVLPRLRRRTLAVTVSDGAPELVAATEAALAAQDEQIADAGEATAFLAPGCLPAPDWSHRILDTLAEGYGAVGGSIELEGGFRDRRTFAGPLAAWRPGFGRAPGWERPLLCPALVAECLPGARWHEPLVGLPALAAPGGDSTSLCDGRIRVRVPATALRRAGRPRG